MNFEELKEKLNGVPSHSGFELEGLLTACTHLNNTMLDVKISISNNEITENEAKLLIKEIYDSLNLLKNRQTAIEDKDEKIIKYKKAKDLMKNLNIKYYINYEDSVKITDLYDILTDDKRFLDLCKKLQMKTFW